MIKILFYYFVLPLLVYLPLIGIFLISPPSYTKLVRIQRNGISNITIQRNNYGVPHIYASDLKNCFYGVGYVHAQDRLWELYFKKLLISGRLSEFFGNKTLEIDKLMRNFGFYRTSVDNYLNLEEKEKKLLQTYSDAINDYVSNLYYLPIEFHLAGVPFEKWDPVDTLSIIKVMEFSLTLEWQAEMLKYHLLEYFDKDFIEQITGSGVKNQYHNTTILNDDDLKQSNIFSSIPFNKTIHKSIPYKPKTTTNEFDNMIESLFLVGRGSNSWIIHGNHTISGKPILANDPHLDNAMPSIWYPIEINYGNEKQIFGFSNAGTPFIMIGKTRDICWGITALIGDDSDIFIEEFNIQKTHYIVDGKYFPLNNVNEIIRVKGQFEPVIENVVFTSHGPIINNILESIFNVKYTLNHHFAFAWTGYLQKSSAVNTLLSVYYSKNVYEVKDAMQNLNGLYLNIIFMDKMGNIAYTSTGIHKIKNEESFSFFPLNGTNSKHNWIGYVPKNETAYVINPKKGYISTANNKFATDNLLHSYSSNGKMTGRSLRIEQMINEKIQKKQKFSIEDMKTMQLDLKDAYAEITLNLLLKIVKKHVKILKNTQDKEEINSLSLKLSLWDFITSEKSEMAALYNLWVFHLKRNLLNSIKNIKIHRRTVHGYGFHNFLMKKLSIWAKNDENIGDSICQNNKTLKHTNLACAYIILESLLEANYYLKSNNLKTWGEAYSAYYPQKPFSDTPLKFLYDRKLKGKGNGYTVNVNYAKLYDDKFQGTHSSNMRFISDFDTTYYVIDTGVSENILSTHYEDQMRLKDNGEYLIHQKETEYIDKIELIQE